MSPIRAAVPLFGGVGALAAIAVALLLPETVRWLVAHGRHVEAERIVARLEAKVLKRGRQIPVPLPAAAEVAPTRPAERGTRLLLRPVYLKRLIATALMFGLYIFALYGFATWIPTVLVNNGMSQSEALGINSVIVLGGAAAPFLLMVVADRIQRKTALFIEFIVAGLGVAVFGFLSDPAALMIVGFIANVAYAAGTMTFYTYVPEIFPTGVRGSGTGAVNAFGRVAGLIQGVAVGALLPVIGSQGLFVLLGGIFIVVAVMAAILGRRTSRMSAESASAEQ